MTKTYEISVEAKARWITHGQNPGDAVCAIMTIKCRDIIPKLNEDSWEPCFLEPGWTSVYA